MPGRFELIEEGQPFAVVVDYAHTPDGLENILQTAKAIQENRIIVVFGCGGDRDATKRPIMGRIAAQYGDVVYVTSDNPRTEDPVQIVKDVEVGVKEGLREGSHYEVIVDRREAIQHAIQNAKPGDIVLIAGKGHEDYQILRIKRFILMIVKRREQPSRRSNMAEFTLSQVVEATEGTSTHTENIKFLDVSMIQERLNQAFYL